MQGLAANQLGFSSFRFYISPDLHEGGVLDSLPYVQVVARRSTLSLLWGIRRGYVRVQQRQGIMYLDRAYKVTPETVRSGHRLTCPCPELSPTLCKPQP